jgi:hypothetical protein
VDKEVNEAGEQYTGYDNDSPRYGIFSLQHTNVNRSAADTWETKKIGGSTKE